jgi:hypothetical protein
MDKFWLALLTGLIFLLISVACLMFPKKIQSCSMDLYSDEKRLAKYNPFKEWMKTPSYIISLRLIGILSLCVFFLMIYALFRI